MLTEVTRSTRCYDESERVVVYVHRPGWKRHTEIDPECQTEECAAQQGNAEGVIERKNGAITLLDDQAVFCCVCRRVCRGKLQWI